MLSVWQLWTIAAILLFIAEVFTPGFIFVCVGLACLVAALFAALGLGLKLQIVGFIAGTALAFFGVRPFFVKYLHKASSGVKTNMDALIGATGCVSERISEEANSGRAMVRGDDWKAIAIDGEEIEKGAKIEVVKAEGIKLYVKRV